MRKIWIALILISIISCKTEYKDTSEKPLKESFYKELTFSENVLDYRGIPEQVKDKKQLMFSDQGAWFAYGLNDSITGFGGFSGPFLMTEQNGVWISSNLMQLALKTTTQKINWVPTATRSYNSHIEQSFNNESLEIQQRLVFSSGHTARIETQIKNVSSKEIVLEGFWKGKLFEDHFDLTVQEHQLNIHSDKTTAIGHLLFQKGTKIQLIENGYQTQPFQIIVQPNETQKVYSSQTFIFPEYDWVIEKNRIEGQQFSELLRQRKEEKNQQIQALVTKKRAALNTIKYDSLLAKCIVTMQNNWRIPAGEIKHEGMFPSYHYTWFHGFWSWDTWKQAVGVANYDVDVAKKQMKLMFEFQEEDGFIVDVVYRDTTIEKHNDRDTKPPLSAWAVQKIYEKDKDVDFVKEMYPKLKKYHYWWYLKRDHDQDGLCEYGSTDGSLIAAKWESGMDNAIRFDNTKMLKNSEGAYSMNQESVDLNAYLYAEKMYLATLAKIIGLKDDAEKLGEEANVLKTKIQRQFFDPSEGWFYDTNLEGKQFIKGEGSEGWIPLWANVATDQQAVSIKNRMLVPEKFYTKVPFQTMSADHPKFNPKKGYWRGPNWLDQAYFGIKGLRNYGFDKEANEATIKLLEGAEGILQNGKAIRENYHPLTGEGLNAHNFSWSAAHIIMLLVEEKQS